MNIIISGYGRMGREVEEAATAAGHRVVYRLNSAGDWHKEGQELKKADVVIDFSWPESVLDNIRRAFNLGLPVVTGTTGWYDNLPQAMQWCEKERQSLFVAANFSIGVNVMQHLVGKLARMMDRFGDYTLSIEEIHHIHKKDSPSGTAIRLAEAVRDHSEKISGWTMAQGSDPYKLLITSTREGEEPGTHIVRAESGYDSLQIVHRAKSRKGFAAGALMAAEWLMGKQGFFTMKDLLELTD